MPDERSTPSSRPSRRDQPGPSQSQSRYLKTARPAAPSPPEPPVEPPPPEGRRLSRREAIVAGAVGAGGLVAGGVWLATRGDEPTPEPAVPTSAQVEATPTEPELAIEPTATPEIVPTSPAQVPAEDALVETSLSDIAGYIGRREVSVSALVEAAIERITLNDTIYGAVIEVNPDAREIARQRDEELARGEYRGLLHGVPVLLKDIFATGDSMRTTSGALALEENAVAEDANVVKRLRDAGAVILGKTNMTEWSNVRSGGQTAGWSDRGGQTRNPYDTSKSPWGSSSGSAAAVALSYAPVALGSETNGSIICPAAACGVVGMKPTVGLVSRIGVMPVARTLDSPGPMARTVADVAATMNVLAGYDPEDPSFGRYGWTSPATTVGGSPVPEYGGIDYTAGLDPNALRGARLGICWQLWGMDPAADEVGQRVVERLREAGAEIVENVVIPSLGELDNFEGIGDIVGAEFAAGMAIFFERFMPDGPIHSIEEVVEWNVEHADIALTVSGQDGLIDNQDALSLDDPYYIETVTRLVTLAREEGMDAAMDEYDLDAIIAPTAPVPTEITIGGGTDFAGSSARASSMAGYPSITVPMGDVDGLPVGLHLSGRAFSEERLIALAYSIEQLLQARIPPRI